MKRLVVGIIIGIAVLFFGGTAGGDSHSCKVENVCPGDAACSGSYYSTSGCTVTCWNSCGSAGQICWAGEAKCSQSGKAGGGVQDPTP